MRGGKIRVGIIGFGEVSRYRFLPELIKHDGFELTSVADILPEYDAFNGVTRPDGVKYHKLDSGNNYKIPPEFFDKVDVVYIASPNGYHVSQTVKALLSYGKFVITEKPVARTREELDTLNSVTDNDGYSSKLFCQDHYIFKPINRFALETDVVPELISKYRPIKNIKVTFFEGGGTLDGPRGKWIISPEAGGGVYIDIGPHMNGVLYKVFKAEFVNRRNPKSNPKLYDMYSKRDFKCETGFYDKFLVKGEYFERLEKPNVVMKIAKGVKTNKTRSGYRMPDFRAKMIEVNLNGVDLLMNYEDLHDCSEYVGNRIKKERGSGLKYLKGKGIKNDSSLGLAAGIHLIKDGACENLMTDYFKQKFSAKEYQALLDIVENWIRNGGEPYLDVHYAEQSHKAIFNAYDSVGGVQYMKEKLKGSLGDTMGLLVA